MVEQNKKQKWYKTFQFFAGYLVAAWTFLQFFDWILKRNNISPNWVDLLLWIFIGIIPSLLVYLYHQDRIHDGKIKLKEKILVPLNVVLLTVVIYIGFGNADLGATTKKVSYENEQGKMETQTFTKEEFRVGIPIFGFEQVDKNNILTSWLRYGIGKILYQDLLQNKNITPDFNYYTDTTTKIREASLFYDKYVDGSYQVSNDTYTINVNIRKASNAKILSEKTFTGKDFLALLDDISVFIASEAEQSGKNVVEYIDLPINEFMSSSIPAIQAFANSNYSLAYSIDKYFALAYLEDAKNNRMFNGSKLEIQDIIDKASKYKSKLPLQKQLEVLIQKNLAYGKYDEAEQQIKLQLEVDPNNVFYNSVLFSIFGETKNLEDYFKVAEKLFEQNPNSTNGSNLAIASMVAGNEQELIDAISAFEIINPEIKTFKIEPYIFKGEINKAKSIFEEYKESHSNNANRYKVYDSIFTYLKKENIHAEALQSFVGSYRSNINEQTVEYWIENNKLIEYVKNQIMKTYVYAGPDAYGGGFVNIETNYGKLVRNQNNEVIALKKSDYGWNSTFTRLFWKLDNSIVEAEKALENKDLGKAEQLYKKAIENNPDHVFLKNIYKHILFRKKTDTLALLDQFHRHKGNYGPRNFWIENDKFYYKRKGEDADLPKVELLPMSDSLYMDMTRLGTLMGFKKSGNSLVSVSYSFNLDTFEFEKSDVGNNTFEKEQ